MLRNLIVGLLFISGMADAASQYSGIYRDNNFNLMSHQGSYVCSIYSLPKDVLDTESYSDKKLGEANVVIENEENGTGRYAFINLNNSKELEVPLLKQVEKGSSRTIYGGKSDGLKIAYTLLADKGAFIFIQDHKKGQEMSVLLTGCNLMRNYDESSGAFE